MCLLDVNMSAFPFSRARVKINSTARSYGEVKLLTVSCPSRVLAFEAGRLRFDRCKWEKCKCDKSGEGSHNQEQSVEVGLGEVGGINELQREHCGERHGNISWMRGDRQRARGDGGAGTTAKQPDTHRNTHSHTHTRTHSLTPPLCE